MRIRLRTTLAGPALTAGPATSSPSHPHWAALIEAGYATPEATHLPRRPPPGRNVAALADGTGSMSILVVTAPAARPGLTTVAMAKRELGITGSADHDFLEDLILQASAAIEGWCRRVFGREEVTEMFRLSAERAVLHLARWPNITLASIGENDVTLAADDWELDAATGELWRLDDADRRVAWPAAKIVVAYAAGYVLPGDPQRDLPEGLERACLETVKARWFARLRDPLAKSEQVQGIATGCRPPGTAIPACRQAWSVCSTLSPAHGLRTIAMLNPGIYSLGDQVITTAVTALVLTPVVDLDGLTAVTLQVRFAPVSGGTTCKAWVQTSLDQGQTWADIFCAALHHHGRLQDRQPFRADAAHDRAGANRCHARRRHGGGWRAG